MSTLKYFRRGFLLLALLLVGFMSIGETAFAATRVVGDGIKSTVSMKWVDRATVKVENINLDDDDSGLFSWNLSDEAGAIYENISAARFNTLLNVETDGDYKDSDIWDGENYFLKNTCQDQAGVVFDDTDGTDYNTYTDKGAIIIDSLSIKPEDVDAPFAGVGNAGVCRFVLDGAAIGNARVFNGVVRMVTTMGDLHKRDIWFRFEDGDTLKRVDGRQTYKRTVPPNNKDENSPEYKAALKVFALTDSGGVKPDAECGGKRSRLEFIDDLTDKSKKELRAKYVTCDEAGDFDVTVIRTGDEGSSETIETDPDSVDGEGQPEDCEVQMLNPLTWLICPLISGAVTAINELDNAITGQLTIQTEGSTSVYDEVNSQSGKALFNVWGAFRYISLGILVIIGLIMIISQAMSFGIFDAYTIKKILPKILIGVVGISVSWYLCKFAIDFFNDLGIGVRSLLYGPFKDAGEINFDDGVSSILIGAGGVALFALGIVGSLSFVLTAVLAVIIAFGILVFRQILIMLLVITAPLAIICWILPNTERVWKMWWDFFLRALVVFPIIALFIAGGRVIAQLATMHSTQTGENDLLTTTIAFIAYFGPYFALPAAFRLAGGAIAQIGGIANNRSKGLFDRLGNFRGERRKKRVEEFRNAGFYNTDTRRGRLGNKIGGMVFDADERVPYMLGKNGKGPFGRRSKELAAKIEGAKHEQTVDMYKYFDSHAMGNDKVFAAAGGSLTDLSEKTRNAILSDQKLKGVLWDDVKDKDGNVIGQQGLVLDSAQRFSAMRNILSKSDDSTERIASEALGRIESHVTNRYRDGNGYASVAGASMLGLAMHGFGSEESAVELANKIKADDGGHNEFAESMLVMSEVHGKTGRFAGYGHSVDKKGNIITGTAAGRSWAGTASKGASVIAGLKRGQAVEQAKNLIGIKEYAAATDTEKANIRARWKKEEGLSDDAILARTGGYFSDTDTSAEGIKAREAFQATASQADETLFSLMQSYIGGSTDTRGAINGVIGDAIRDGLIKDPNETLNDAQKAAARAKGAAAASELSSAGTMTPPPIQGNF